MKLCTRLLVVVLMAATPVAAQYSAFVGGKNKVRYDTFAWKVYETPHFRISYYDRVEPVLPKIASYAESSYDELARRLNFQLTEPVPLITYATHAEFEQTNTIVDFIPEGVGAFATPVRNRMVLPVDLQERELQALIQHELTHIFQYELLFGGRSTGALYRRPALWFMEGMASYFGHDEDSRDRAYMRDAALTERVPSITNPPEGFLAYRYGHVLFDFIEAEWGEDGVRDFIYGFRNGFGAARGRAFEKVFNLDPEEFDARFRTWLRKHYAEDLDRGLPSEFGRRFRVTSGSGSLETSPVASPSGDLVAAFSTYKNTVDVVIFGVPDRRLWRNLTRGFTTRYEYLVAQALTVAGDHGRDLAFSPDGNLVAVFARAERTRNLFLLDANHGGIEREIPIELPIDEAMEPAFSPDGHTVAFRAFEEGQADIFLLDLESGAITNLTNDATYDAAPVFRPDGKALAYSSQVGDWMKLVEVDLTDPTRRRELTTGPGNDEAPALSKDGKHLFFASDRENGVFDIYQLELETGRLTRLTHVYGAALNPVPVTTLEGERVVFQGFARGGWDLYVVDPGQGVEVGKVEQPPEGVEVSPFVPAITVPVDLAQGKEVKHHKLFVENAQAFVGVDQNNTIVSQAYLSWSDNYGDRRIQLVVDSIDTFSNFQASYINLEKRLQWGALVFDDRSYFVYGYDPVRDQFNKREQIYRQTGALGLAYYPLSTYHRLQGAAGYIDRSAYLPALTEEGDITFISSSDQLPYVSVGAAGDTAVWRPYGPHAGSRWEADLAYAYDLQDGGALTEQITVDARKYLPLSDRNEVAMRVFLAVADGNRPSVFAIGGMDTLRGVSYRSIAGNRVGFATLEWRFPIIDELRMPFLQLGDVRGRFFADVGAAWYDIDGQEYNYLGEPGFTFMEGGRLKDGVSSYGFGFTVYLFGLPLHWDFVRRWDLKDSLGDMESNFWIGYQF